MQDKWGLEYFKHLVKNKKIQSLKHHLKWTITVKQNGLLLIGLDKCLEFTEMVW